MSSPSGAQDKILALVNIKNRVDIRIPPLYCPVRQGRTCTLNLAWVEWLMVEEHPLPHDALENLESSTASADVRRIAAELLPAFYDELRRIAHRSRARLGAGHTLQTTALVHEAYLRLGQSRSFADETHFLRAAALAMRHALINYARSRVTHKRGGGGQHVTLSNIADLTVETDEGMLALHEAMVRLASEDPRLADVVECRFFGGYGEEDTARTLGMSLRTVQRDWLKARAWLYRELGGTST